jgi:hypothetical protein
VSLDVQVTMRSVTTRPSVSRTVADSGTVCPVRTLALAGSTTTDPTETMATITLAVVLTPSLVAVMTVEPGATAVTTPSLETRATSALPDANVTVRPVRTVPSALFVVGVNAALWPGSSARLPGWSVTDATGTGATVIVAVPVWPPLVAEMLAVPAARPVTIPVVETVATATLLDVHVTTASGTTAPAASFTVAVSAAVPPAWTFAELGSTATLAMGRGTTVTELVPACPSLVAVIVAEPGATPVTIPVADTVATAGALELQVTVRSVSTAPLASFAVAVSGTAPPTTSDALPGEIARVETGARVTVMVAVPDFPSLCAVMIAVPADVAVTAPVSLTLATSG